MAGLSVSVVLVTYNRAHLVLRALRSVLSQVRPEDEVIVVDDGSTDGTREALEPHFGRIKYFRRGNAGQSAGMNFAFARATGDLIALLDDDDEWMPNKLELQRRVLEACPGVLYSFTSFSKVGADGTERPGFLKNARGVFDDWKKEHSPPVPFSSISSIPEGHEDFDVYFGSEYASLMLADYMVGGLLVVRRRESSGHLHFPEDVRYCKDWEFQARLARIGTAAYLDCDLYRWRDHAGARYADLGALEKASSRLTILERMWGRNEEFVARHGDELRRRIDGERNNRVREFLIRGDTESARRELKLISAGSPLSFRALSLLPGGAVKLMLDVRRSLRRGFKS